MGTRWPFFAAMASLTETGRTSSAVSSDILEYMKQRLDEEPWDTIEIDSEMLQIDSL